MIRAVNLFLFLIIIFILYYFKIAFMYIDYFVIIRPSQLKVQLCILLDDIQYMDYRSWEFLSSAINNYNVAIVMTMPKPNFWEDLSHVETEIYKDKRLMKHTLLGLNVDLFPVFACQFLNVVGIPRELSRYRCRLFFFCG